jgi:hypothetical protein
MPAQTTRLFRLEELQQAADTGELAGSDLDALRATAEWIESFIVKPNKDLGRAGPVCPFVPKSLEYRTLWLAPERIADSQVSDVVQLLADYHRLLLERGAPEGDGAGLEVIVVVFTDLSADRAQDLFGEALQQLAVPAYVEDGIILGPFYEGNEGTAIYNPSFRPFQSPVPFVFVRHGVVRDWKFFLDEDDWLGYWARRYGETGARALAAELRRLPWRVDSASS